ncbi:MAG: ferredoxin--NADP reductase [Desulfococcaceae bacterium]
MGSSASVWTAKLRERRWLCRPTFEAVFSLPTGFDFEPGQHVRFRSRRLEREYSMASVPADGELRFCVRDVGVGRFSSVLAKASIGEEFSFTGPHGYFRFRPSARVPLFVATGTGVAPFVAMARSGVSDFWLVHGIRTPGERFYRDLFQKSARRYVACISGPKGSGFPAGAFPGRVTDYLAAHLPMGRYDAYLCGRGEMIRDVTLLLDERFPDSRVFTEAFF